MRSLSSSFQRGIFSVLLLLLLKVYFASGQTACANCAACLSSSINHVLISSDFNAADFQSCSTITEVTFGAAVTTISDNSFNGATSLVSVHFDASSAIDSIGNNAFNSTALTGSLAIPAGVTYIGVNAFRGVAGISSLSLPSTLTRIYSGAFMNVAGLASVTIPNSVNRIDASAFQGTGLTSLTFSGFLLLLFFFCKDLTFY